eukprot:COSAG01_NODE_71829_length_254_cov_1.967742_1_plen_59_part_01
MSVAVAQSSALAGGRRASAARRENLLCRGRQPLPKNLVGMRRHLTLTRDPAAGGRVREE